MSAAVLGVDPGVSETGWALLEASDGTPRLVDSGLIKTYPNCEFPERLNTLHRSLSAVLDKHRPTSVAIEEMFFLKAAHTIRKTLQARGVLVLAAAQRGHAIKEYNPRSVKLSLTGNGQAKKAQVQSAVKRALGLADILRPDDVSDAAAIALCHLRSQRISRLRVLERHGASA